MDYIDAEWLLGCTSVKIPAFSLWLIVFLTTPWLIVGMSINNEDSIAFFGYCEERVVAPVRWPVSCIFGHAGDHDVYKCAAAISFYKPLNITRGSLLLSSRDHHHLAPISPLSPNLGFDSIWF
jgi:hypothetical protein